MWYTSTGCLFQIPMNLKPVSDNLYLPFIGIPLKQNYQLTTQKKPLSHAVANTYTYNPAIRVIIIKFPIGLPINPYSFINNLQTISQTLNNNEYIQRYVACLCKCYITVLGRRQSVQSYSKSRDFFFPIQSPKHKKLLTPNGMRSHQIMACECE